MNAQGDISEKQLIINFKTDLDQKWLGLLISPYLQLIYGLCLKYFKDSSKAEDAVMDIYELVGRRILNHEVENFRPWLYVVSKNFCLERLRRNNNRKAKEKEAFLMYSEEVFHPDEEKNEVLFEKMTHCIEKLELVQKTCVQAFYFEKKSYEQIAEQHQWSWNKVRSSIQNGRRNLRTCIEKKKKIN